MRRFSDIPSWSTSTITHAGLWSELPEQTPHSAVQFSRLELFTSAGSATTRSSAALRWTWAEEISRGSLAGRRVKATGTTSGWGSVWLDRINPTAKFWPALIAGRMYTMNPSIFSPTATAPSSQPIFRANHSLSFRAMKTIRRPMGKNMARAKPGSQAFSLRSWLLWVHLVLTTGPERSKCLT